MTPQAYKFLLNRVSNYRPERRTVEPSAVKVARRIIKDYEHDDYKQEVSFRQVVDRQRVKVKEIVHAGDYGAALKAIKAFEAMMFKVS